MISKSHFPTTGIYISFFFVDIVITHHNFTVFDFFSAGLCNKLLRHILRSVLHDDKEQGHGGDVRVSISWGLLSQNLT